MHPFDVTIGFVTPCGTGSKNSTLPFACLDGILEPVAEEVASLVFIF